MLVRYWIHFPCYARFWISPGAPSICFYPDADTAGMSNLNCGAVQGIGGGPKTAINTRLGKHHVQGGKVSDGSPLGPQVKTSDRGRRWRQYEGAVLLSGCFLTLFCSFCLFADATLKAKALNRSFSLGLQSFFNFFPVRAYQSLIDTLFCSGLLLILQRSSLSIYT